MKFFIFSLMLAAAAHAITCTEGHFLFSKDKGSFYLNEDDVIIDKYFVDFIDSEDSSSYKYIREQGRVVIEREMTDRGALTSDTNVFYLINDINSPAVDNSIAYTKSLLGDTTLIEAILREPGDDENEASVTEVRMKFFKNGATANYHELTPKDQQYISEIHLKNDTLFSFNISSSNDTVGYSFIVNDKDDKQVCHEFYKMKEDASSSNMETRELTDRYYRVKENETGFVFEKVREYRIDQYFMTYTDGHTTSIAKRPVARMKQPSRNYYFDTKGRKQFKAIPYRVQF
ncbi:hypothetical protein [Fibrobacter sp.]|uniref:hypothetical protein n=1 Tax=Fibrobacter sp. TaxID=35828 RepID=UPI003865184B